MSPDDVPENRCAHTFTQTVCQNLRSITLVYITVEVNNIARFTVDRTLLMLALRGKERKKKVSTQIFIFRHTLH